MRLNSMRISELKSLSKSSLYHLFMANDLNVSFSFSSRLSFIYDFN